MALARVQATGKVTADSATSVTLTFSTPPTVGNGIVIPVIGWGSAFPAATASCSDNRGNTYTLATKANGTGTSVVIFYCALVAAAAAPFTITLSATAAVYWVATAIEVSGVETGLLLDQTISQTATGTAVSTGATPALTATEVWLVAAQSNNGSQASITVESVSPVWTQEAEDLSWAHAVGESDSRVITGAVGTPASCSWMNASVAAWVAALAAFRTVSGGAPAAVATATPFVWGPL